MRGHLIHRPADPRRDLPQSEIPTSWYNIQAALPEPLPPVIQRLARSAVKVPYGWVTAPCRRPLKSGYSSPYRCPLFSSRQLCPVCCRYQ